MWKQWLDPESYDLFKTGMIYLETVGDHLRLCNEEENAFLGSVFK